MIDAAGRHRNRVGAEDLAGLAGQRRQRTSGDRPWLVQAFAGLRHGCMQATSKPSSAERVGQPATDCAGVPGLPGCKACARLAMQREGDGDGSGDQGQAGAGLRGVEGAGARLRRGAGRGGGRSGDERARGRGAGGDGGRICAAIGVQVTTVAADITTEAGRAAVLAAARAGRHSGDQRRRPAAGHVVGLGRARISSARSTPTC